MQLLLLFIWFAVMFKCYYILRNLGGICKQKGYLGSLVAVHFFLWKMERESTVSLIIATFAVLQLADEAYSCSSEDQIYQNGTCCQPIFNCEPGKGVSFCTSHSDKDMCIPCKEGEIQPQLVSSLDGIGATCFSNKGEDECHSDELMPARLLNNSVCGIPCLCNVFNCYFGDDPCRCRKNSNGCGFNETMNKITGECEPCPKHTFKNNTGCGPCYYNEAEWFNAHRNGSVAEFPPSSSNFTPKPSTTKATSETQSSNSSLPRSISYVLYSTNFPGNEHPKDSSTPNWLIPTVVVLLILVIVLAVVSAVLTYRLCRQRWKDKQNTATGAHRDGVDNAEKKELVPLNDLPSKQIQSK